MQQVTLVPSSRVNGDLGVVNAARVSFAKERDEVLLHGDPRIPAGEKGDDRLIFFLANHGHWSPMAHPTFVLQMKISTHTIVAFALVKPAGVRLIPSGEEHDYFFVAGSLYGLMNACHKVFNPEESAAIKGYLMDHAPISASALGVGPDTRTLTGFGVSEETMLSHFERGDPFTQHGVFRTFRIKSPIAVARQLGKHQVDLVWNEVSRRYVDFEPELYRPEGWRERASDKKQGSGENLVGDIYVKDYNCHVTPEEIFKDIEEDTLLAYRSLLAGGVCPEQARFVLPQSMMTEWWWTGSIDACARIVNQRTHDGVQKETNEVAVMMDEILAADLGELWAKARAMEGQQ